MDPTSLRWLTRGKHSALFGPEALAGVVFAIVTTLLLFSLGSLNRLFAQRVFQIQGHVYAKPMPLDALQKWMAAR